MGDKHSAPGAVFTVPNSLTQFGIDILYEGHLHWYFGKISFSVPNLATSNAAVKFNSTEQFNGHSQVSRRLGAEGISMVLSNGPTLEGVLDKPLSSSTVISGSGYWSQI